MFSFLVEELIVTDAADTANTLLDAAGQLQYEDFRLAARHDRQRIPACRLT